MWERAVEVTAAPYSLVRVAALTVHEDEPAAARHRSLAERLTAALAVAAELGGPLADALHDRAGDEEDTDFRRRVLLPLRRDVYNQRTPRPAVRAELGALGDRVELLGRWLRARDEADTLAADIAGLTPDALAADRRALAVACRQEPLRRAVTLVGDDLLRAVDRAAAQGAEPDARARKSEASVLRYAVRAATKTAPLTWFSSVSWGRWGGGANGVGCELVAEAQPDRRTVAELLGAVLTSSPGCFERLHHLPGDLRVGDGQVVFRRTRPGHDAGGGPTEEVRLPLHRPAQHVIDRATAAGSVAPRRLAREIGERLPAVATPGAAEAYIGQLIERGLLLPDLPVAAQDPRPLATLAGVLDRDGASELAERIRRIDEATRTFPAVPAQCRPAALADLRGQWDEARAMVGLPPSALRSVLAEDVAAQGVRALGASDGQAAIGTLQRLVPLFEIFDTFTVLHAVVRDHFVARYGIGGRCSSVARFAEDIGELWRQAGLVGPDGAVHADADLGPAAMDVAGRRARLVKAAASGTVACGTTATDEVVVADDVVDQAAALLPDWALARPVSYSIFCQSWGAADGVGLCVNRIYGGWGRFTSRFLRQLPDAATHDVTAQLRRALRGGRVAQLRPVGGFNANLHPLLVPDEIADASGHGTIRTSDVHLVHDAGTDRIRLRHASTGDDLDVLYLGFLIPLALPGHLGLLTNDLGSGLVDADAGLAPGRWTSTPVGRVHVRPRLRHRDVILSRRTWRLPEAVADELRAELSQADGRHAVVAARWRAALGLPAQVFVSSRTASGAADPAGDSTGFDAVLSYFGRRRSQFVDLGSALQLRCLPKTLAGHAGDLVFEEALPVPQPGRPVTEMVVETYRSRS